MKLLTTLAATIAPFAAQAEGVYPVGSVAWPILMLSQSGHIVGGAIVIGALLSFYRRKDG